MFGALRAKCRNPGTEFRKPEIKAETVPGKMNDYAHIDVRIPRFVRVIVRASSAT
ncbi:MAG: hypothetical protein ACLTBF_04625 [Christensenellales bacterium]